MWLLILSNNIFLTKPEIFFPLKLNLLFYFWDNLVIVIWSVIWNVISLQWPIMFVCWSVGWSDSRSVIISTEKGREVTHPCSFRNTCFIPVVYWIQFSYKKTFPPLCMYQKQWERWSNSVFKRDPLPMSFYVVCNFYVIFSCCILSTYLKKASLWPSLFVYWLVGRSVGRSVCHN